MTALLQPPTVRVPTGTRQSYPQGQNRQSGFLKFEPGTMVLDNLRDKSMLEQRIIIPIALAMLVLSDKKPEIVEEYNHVKR